MTSLTVKKWIFRSLYFLMVKGSLNPNITSIGEKLWPVAWKQKFTSVIEEKKWKIAIKSVKMKILKNKKMCFPKITQLIRFLGQKVCPVARSQTEHCEHPFMVSGFFPSTYHQGSAQKLKKLMVKKGYLCFYSVHIFCCCVFLFFRLWPFYRLHCLT